MDFGDFGGGEFQCLAGAEQVHNAGAEAGKVCQGQRGAMVAAGEVVGNALGFAAGVGEVGAFEAAASAVVIGPAQFVAHILPAAAGEDADADGTGFDGQTFQAGFRGQGSGDRLQGAGLKTAPAASVRLRSVSQSSIGMSLMNCSVGFVTTTVTATDEILITAQDWSR